MSFYDRRAVWFVLLLAGAFLSPAYAATTDKGVEIGGRVVSATGAGVVEARVKLFPVVDKYERSLALLKGGDEPTASTRTDAAGRFRLVAPEIGLWILRLEAGGYVDAEVAIRPLLGPVELPPLVLTAAEELVVRVTDPKGEPVAGARVLAEPQPDEKDWRRRSLQLPRSELALRSVETGADGSVRLAAAPGEELRVVADAGAGRAQAEARGGGALALTVEAGAERRLRVVDERQRPVAAAVILTGDEPLPVAVTDAEGWATVHEPRRKPKAATKAGQSAAQWTALAPGGLSGTVTSAAAPVQSSGEQPPAETIVVRPEPRLTGQVVDAESRRPIAGALVWIAGAGAAAAPTDARGSYELAGDAEGILLAVADGYSPAGAVLEGGEASRTLALPAGAWLSGRVVDEAGQPVAGVAVAAQASDQIARGNFSQMIVLSFGTFFGAQQTLSAPDGTFHLAALSTSGGLKLACEKEGFAPAEQPVEKLAPRERRADLRVVLSRGRTAFGRVVDEHEAPIAGAEVQLQRSQGEDRGLEQLSRWRRRLQRGEQQEGHRTDAAGLFRIPGLTPGRYDLDARASGFAPSTVPGLEIADGRGDADLGTLMLVPGAEVAGRVVDAAGQPLAGAEVRITETRDRPRFFGLDDAEDEHATDAGGRFTVGDLQPGGQFALAVSKEGYVTETILNVTAPTTTPIQVVLQRSARIAGRVVDEAHAPVARAEVQVAPGDFHRVQTETSDADGAFELTDASPGTLELTVEAQGYQRYRQVGIELAPGGEITDLEIVLKRGAELTGTVSTADGKPAAGAILMVSRAGAQHGRPEMAFADDDGRYTLTSLDVGPHLVTVEHNTYGRTVREVDVQAGSNTLDLKLDGGVAVSGRVLGPEGEPAAGAQVYLLWARGQLNVVSGADGGFDFPSVKAGSYNLSAAAEGYARGEHPEPVEVADEPVAGLVVQLETGTKLSGQILGLEFDDLPRVEVAAYSDQGGYRKGQVDYQGRYTIAHLAPGDWKVQAELEGSGRRAEGEVAIAPGMPEAVLDLELGDGFTLTGSVWRGDVPVRGAELILSDEDDGYNASTNPDGSFRLEGLTAGEYKVAVRERWIVYQELPEPLVIDGDREVRLELAALGQISGRLRDRLDLSPIDGARLALKPHDAGKPGVTFTPMSTSDSRGLFLFRDVVPGSWRLQADKAGYAASELEIELAAGETLEGLEIEMSPTDDVVLTVALPAGQRPHNVMLAVHDGAGRSVVQGYFEPTDDGRIRLSNVPAGTWQLLIAAPGAGTVEAPLTAPGDAGRIQLPPGGSLQVTVSELVGDGTTDGAASAESAAVTLIGPSGRPHRRFDGSNSLATVHPLYQGRFLGQQLTVGSWQVRVEAADGRTWAGTAVVTAGGTAELTLP